MKVQLVELGREKFSGVVEVNNQYELMAEVAKHLMSSEIAIEWNPIDGGGVVRVGPMGRPVGAIVIIKGEA